MTNIEITFLKTRDPHMRNKYHHRLDVFGDKGYVHLVVAKMVLNGETVVYEHFIDPHLAYHYWEEKNWRDSMKRSVSNEFLRWVLANYPPEVTVKVETF